VIDTVTSALFALQRSLIARSLYSPSHPTVNEGAREAHGQLARVLATTEQVRIFVGYDRARWDDRQLPASKALGDKLLAAARDAGIDRITFRRDVTAAELSLLLDTLSGSRTVQELEACPGLELGHIADHSDPEHAFADLVENCVETIAGVHHGIATENALDESRLEKLVEAIAAVVKGHSGALVPLLETKRHDEYTFIHTTNVSIVSGTLAETLALDRKTIHEITIAALLHDVGKQGVPEEVLNRKGRLSDEERRIVQSHAAIGAQMLLATPGVPSLAPIVAYEHHMRSDGGGYPPRPPKWKLNLASRIVQLADVFDALRTNRPYRAAVPIERIREIMRNDFDSPLDSWLLNLLFREVVDRDAPG
jgi:putative nucleotidyltransferase with HDIG domain